MSGLRDRLLRMRGSAALRDELRAGMPDSEEEQKEQKSNSTDAEQLDPQQQQSRAQRR